MNDDLRLAPLLAEVARLQRSVGSAGVRNPMLDEALSSLEHSVEELQVASEELQVKNEELLLALTDLDDERRRYRDLFDLAADGELLGQPAESLLGCRLLDLIAAASRTDALRRMRAANSGHAGEVVLLM